MKKRKKKKKGTNSFLEAMDSKMNGSYLELLDEINGYQKKIKKSDKKVKKKLKKLKKKNNKEFILEYSNSKKRNRTRDKIFGELRGNESGINYMITEYKPLGILLSRLIGAGILSVLSINSVKANMTDNRLNFLRSVYEFCMKVK